MDLHIVIDPAQPRGEQLLRQLRGLILSGRLAAGAQLPPTRLLASQLGLARQTVAEAYERLVLERLIEARRQYPEASNGHPVRPFGGEAVEERAKKAE